MRLGAVVASLWLVFDRKPNRHYRLHSTRRPELFGGMKGVSSLWLQKA